MLSQMESILYLYHVPILRIRKWRLRELQMVLLRPYQSGVGNMKFWPWPADYKVGPPLSHFMDGLPADQDQIFLSLVALPGSVALHQCHPSPHAWSIYHIQNDFTSSVYVNRNHSLKFNLVNFHLCKQLIQWRQGQSVSSYSSYFHAASPPSISPRRLESPGPL